MIISLRKISKKCPTSYYSMKDRIQKHKNISKRFCTVQNRHILINMRGVTLFGHPSLKHLTSAGYQYKLQHKVNKNYYLVSKYKGNTKSVTIFHKTCGKTFSMKASSALKKQKCLCPYCSRKKFANKRQRHFEHVFYQRKGSEYKLLSQYKNNRIKVLILHKACGHKYWELPSNAYKYGCPYCAGNIQKTPQYFNKEISKLTHGEYTVLSRYKTAQKPVLIQHNKCGYKYHVIPHLFLRGNSRCPRCLQQNRVKSNRMTIINSIRAGITRNQNYVKYCIRHLQTDKPYRHVYKLRLLNHLHALDLQQIRYAKRKHNVYTIYTKGNGIFKIKLLNENKTTTKQKVQIYHTSCKKTFIRLRTDFSRGLACPYCNYASALTTSIFKYKLQKASDGNLILVSKYKKAMDDVVLECKQCHHRFKMRANLALYKPICPYCFKSVGEYCIAFYLKKHHIKYIHGYVIPMYRNADMDLHLDFYIPKWHLGIEYDGLPHFNIMPKMKSYGGKEGLKRRQHRDKKKDIYCVKHHITLIRIEMNRNHAKPLMLRTIISKLLSQEMKYGNKIIKSHIPNVYLKNVNKFKSDYKVISRKNNYLQLSLF